MGMKPKTKGNIIMALVILVMATVMISAIILRLQVDKLYFRWLMD